ncbi:MAG: CatB-related O-acetyltransferase [Solirubrobacterales bacterium]|nr:CatB-related O-acetyltransferase [Solirubrobacterales bacterium]
MERAQAQRVLRRALVRARELVGSAGAIDPLTGELFGALSPSEAVAGGRATIGPHTNGEYRIEYRRGERGRVDIGDYCSIAFGVRFMLGGNHRPDWVSTFPFRILWDMPGAWSDGHPRPAGDITVGNDVWIGAEALILAGVKIGDGAVIATRAVVTRDVRPYAIVAGVPAREVRRRFSDEQIEGLLKLRWWDWPQERVRASVELLCSPDVDALLAAAGSQ